MNKENLEPNNQNENISSSGEDNSQIEQINTTLHRDNNDPININQNDYVNTNGINTQSSLNSIGGNNIQNTLPSMNIDNQSVISNTNEKLGIVSLIIGIIALLLSFILNVLNLPIAITGLIFGIHNIKKKGKNKVGIILNVLAIIMLKKEYVSKVNLI